MNTVLFVGQTFLFVFLFSAVSLMLGLMYTRYIVIDKNSFSLNYVAGFIFMFAIFQVVALPATFLHMSFSRLYYSYLLILLVICMISILLNRQRLSYFIKGKFLLEHFRKDKGSLNYFYLFVVILILANILVNMMFPVFVQNDDAWFVGLTNTTLFTDGLFTTDPFTGYPLERTPWRYVLAPYPIFHAVLSRSFGIHPAIMIRTVLPIVLHMMTVFVIFNIGRMLFKDENEKIAKFLLIYLIAQFFSGTWGASQGYWAILFAHYGRTVLFIALIPFFFYWYMRMFWVEQNKANWILLFALLLAMNMVSQMGVILGAICVGVSGIVYFVQTKKIKEVFLMALCCIPNIVLTILYVLNTNVDIFGAMF